jgi:acyl-CoA thioesterase FadM
VVYRAPAFFGETLIVACRVVWASRSSFGLEYRVDAPHSQVAGARLIAHGTSSQVMFDIKAERVGRVPMDLLALIGRHEGGAVPQRPAG